MASSFVSHRQFSLPNPLQSDRPPYFKKPVWRGQRSVAVRCGRDPLEESKNYYELLGVSVDSSPQEIKDSYRRLQKKYHPDIAGEKGHENTLILNKAYKVLMSNGLREEYDASIGRTRFGVDRSVSGSVWRGPLRPHALFVDENACIGCRECVHHAGNTFVMDEAFGTARVKVQYGDDDGRIEVSVIRFPYTAASADHSYLVVEIMALIGSPLPEADPAAIEGQSAIFSKTKGFASSRPSFTKFLDPHFGATTIQFIWDEPNEISVDSCPVNCIHWVDTEKLEVLEYLIQPQPRAGHGIYGQGWDRPANVFVAAKSFNKQTQQQPKNQHRYETPAQACARERAGRELNLGIFAKFWRWVNRINGDD